MHIYISRYANILTKNIDVINAMGGSRGQMHNILMHLRKCAYTCICIDMHMHMHMKMHMRMQMRMQMHNILMHLRKCAYTCICTHTPIDVLGAPTLPLENSA